MDGPVTAEIALPEGDPGAIRDAAAQLTSIAGGFDHLGTTVSDAAASLSSWEGLASIQFDHACITYAGAAGTADTGCTAAARVLDGWATKLQDGIDRVKEMQRQAAALIETERTANATAASERTALQRAYQQLRMAHFDSALDGGAGVSAAQSAVSQHSDALATAGKTASDARDQIEQLKKDAKQIRDELDREGDAAAKAMWSATDQLPTVSGAPTGSAGGTAITSRTVKDGVAVTIVFIRLGGDKAIIKEHTADGKWKVTRITGVEGGLEFDPVPGAGIDSEGKDAKVGRMGAGADVEAAFVAQYKHGETFSFSNERDADRFIDYRDRSPNPGISGGKAGYVAIPMTAAERANIKWADEQKPESTSDEGGVRASVNVSSPGASAGAEGEVALGTKTNTKDGSTTTYSKAAGSLSGSVSEGPASAGGKINGETITALSKTADGRPTSYSVTVSGAAQGSAGVSNPLEHGDVKSAVTGTEAHGVRIERQTTLDLNDPQNRQAVQDYVDSGGRDTAAAQRLAERLDHAGRVDVRVYDTGTSGVNANVDTKVVKVEVSHTTENAVLDSMHHHGPGSTTTVETVR